MDQATNADQFFIGGVYQTDKEPIGLLLSAVDARRSNSNDMWERETSSTYDSFGSPSTFASTISTH